MSGDVAEIKWNPETMEALRKLFGDKMNVKIGVLSNGKIHEGDTLGAAELAAVHEFGSPSRKIPERSFLRKTAFLKAEEYKVWMFKNKESIFSMIMKGQTDQVMGKVGALWVGFILDCFDTRGFGQWKPLGKRTISRRKKKTDTPLIDTGALRQSITFEVTDK